MQLDRVRNQETTSNAAHNDLGDDRYIKTWTRVQAEYPSNGRGGGTGRKSADSFQLSSPTITNEHSAIDIKNSCQCFCPFS